jgi:putative FmdB family regulatory protein
MIYEYECSACGTVLEKECKIGQAPEKANCQCGKKADRLFTNSGFVLQGGGWPSKSQKINRQQTKNNEKAGERMRGSWEGTQPKLVDG